MRGHVEAAHRGQVPHWSAHRLVRHRDEAHRNLIHCLVRIGAPREAAAFLVDCVRQRRQRSPRTFGIQGFVLVRSEDLGKVLREDATQNQVCIRHGEESVLAIADRPWMGARRLRANLEDAILVEEPAAPTCRDGVDIELGAVDDLVRGPRLKDMLKGAFVAAHVGAGSAHVEADDGLHLGVPACSESLGDTRRILQIPFTTDGVAHHAAGWAGEDASVAHEALCRNQASIGLHEMNLCLAQVGKARAEALHVALKNGREVRVDAGRGGPGHNFDHWGDFTAQRDVLEAHLRCHVLDPPLVVRKGIRVHQAHGDAA
mmetsp:Transcript_10721/g.40281  ORF Transcript_10721/g.40281 Transcript_10721/m.40281 type:complete len:316 (-) Transcript_10721:690-1637(-)